MAIQAPAGLLGIHVNMPATVPPEIAKALLLGGPPPAGLSPEEKPAYDGMDALYKKGSGYGLMMVTRPQTLGYSASQSLAKTVIASGNGALIYQRLEVEVNHSRSVEIMFLLPGDCNT